MILWLALVALLARSLTGITGDCWSAYEDGSIGICYPDGSDQDPG